MRPALSFLFLIAGLTACHKAKGPDAYGNFEADEVTVSSQASGQLLKFSPVEGVRLERGALVAIVDTLQLTLERKQAVAQREVVGARVSEVTDQIGVLEVQRDIAQRNFERTRRLFDQHAATAQQLDQAERDYKTLVAQIDATNAQRRTIGKDAQTTQAQIAQIGNRIDKSRVLNPTHGTVLTTFSRAGEFVQPGTPLYKIANLDTLTLRAYFAESQLSLIKLGQKVRVHVDQGNGNLVSFEGTISWIASKAEFTPTPVQTRDERSGLSYAVKILVPNAKGTLKIGMPGDVEL